MRNRTDDCVIASFPIIPTHGLLKVRKQNNAFLSMCHNS